MYKRILLGILLFIGGVGSASAGGSLRYLTADDAIVAQVKKWQQTGEAKPILSDDGKVLYAYGQEMPKLICSPLRVCDIELEPGEQVVSKPKVGDSARWIIGKMESGTAENPVIHVVVKPTDVNLKTDLIIPTDRHVYYIQLVSENSEKGYFHRVGFYYPEDLTAEWGRDAGKLKRQAEDRDNLVVSDLPSVALDKVDFNYKVDGTAPFRPVRVFNDGRKTYIQMPMAIASGELPTLMGMDDSNNPMLVNYRFKGGYFIVDKVLKKAMLVIGSDDSLEKVMITETVLDKSASAGGWSLFK
jgi:P-type conjugative transfer protein TrbG